MTGNSFARLAILGLAVSQFMAPAPTLGQAHAQAGPEPGCYHRAYSVAHLSANPDQVVAAMRLKIYDSGAERHAAMDVKFADQGHVRRDGHGAKQLKQSLVCFKTSDGAPTCGVECDGGSMRITAQNGTGLTFQTDYLMVGDTQECGGVIDLAEKQGQPVKYRLNRAEHNVCGDM